MKVGVFSVLMSEKPLNQALYAIVKLGLEAVEIGTGNYVGDAHCKVAELLTSRSKLENFKSAIDNSGLEISAFSCHGNPLHPNKKIADAHHKTFQDTVKFANKLNVKTVVNFSGCPGDSDEARFPNWVTCPWPEDFSQIVKWQWEKKVIPYWKSQAKFARRFGVNIAIEMHPGFVVYNTETLLRLRGECGNNIGANFDPSHLFWQGIDPTESLRALKGAVFHVHAKDCKIYETNSKVNGVLDTKHYGDKMNRSWVFRTVGYGHGEDFWRHFVSTLRMIGYDGTLSIEHEDSLMSGSEGLAKAVEFLQKIIFREKVGKMFWA